MTDCHPEDRIKHVVVLMLENRSFDHLFGFEDFGPSSPPLSPDHHPNHHPCDGSPALPSNTATYLAPMDPPHSFEGIRAQINDRAMDGFAQSYHDKLVGNEVVGRLRWLNVSVLFLGLVLTVVLLGIGLRNAPNTAVAASVLVSAVFLSAAAVARWPDRILGPSFKSRTNRYLTWVALFFLASVSLVAVFGIGRGLVACISLLVVFGLAAFIWRKFSGSEAHPDVPCDAVDFPMKCFDASTGLPVLLELAQGFAVCTQWFASVPGETWPNRNFLHAGTSDGDVEIEIGFYNSPTVFDLLDRQYPDEDNWRIYYDGGVPQVAVFRRLWQGKRGAQWHQFRDGVSGFASAVENDDLPKYTFIEPKHYGKGTNSQHPGNNTERANAANGVEDPEGEYEELSDFKRGEAFVAEIYNALRSKYEVFRKTLFVITYDEHGGFFDREAPGSTTAPATWRRSLSQKVRRFVFSRPAYDFKFDELGVRVPAVLVSPWIKQGLIDDTKYDHVSVISTLRELFCLPKAVEPKDRVSRSFASRVCELQEPRPLDDLPDLGPEAAAVDVFEVGERPVPPPSEGFAAELHELGNAIVRELPAVADAELHSTEESDSRLAGDPQAGFVAVFDSHRARAQDLK